jgi:hypothetical protein
MEWNDREKKIIEQLQEYKEEVDTEALWGDIHPQLPVRKKNKLIPLFLFFLAGVGLGVFGYHLFGAAKIMADAVHNQKWKEEKTSLLLKLKICNESKSNTELPKIQTNLVNQSETNKREYSASDLIAVEHKINKSTNTIPEGSLDKIEVEEEYTQYSPKTKTSETSDILQNIKSNTVLLENLNLIPFHINTSLLIQPVFSIVKQQERPQFLQYVMAGGGLSFVNDKIVFENLIQKTHHHPMYQFSLEYGITKRLKKRWFMNLGLNYTAVASHIRYNILKTEDVLISDTTGYYIGNNGIISVETGDIIATKLTQKRGKTYSYTQQIILRPSMEYDIPFNGNSSLSIRLGAMLPLVSWQKSNIINIDGEIQSSVPQFHLFERPYLSSGLMYNILVKEKTIGFYLDVIYRTQYLKTENNINTRTYLLPQTGMRIIF